MKRILLVRTDRLGDVILTLPMLSALHTCFPDASITMLLSRYTGQIVEGHPLVHELLWYDQDGALVPFDRMRVEVAQRNFDAAIVVHPRPRLAWLLFRSDIPVRVGTGYRWYSLLFNRRVFEHRKDAKRHEVEYNLRLLEAIGCAGSAEPEFPIVLTREAEESIALLCNSLGIGLDQRLVVLHPGSGGSAREWPAGYFGILAAKLAEEASVRVIVTGGKGEERKVAEILVATKGKAIPLVGTLTVKELAALFRRANLFVGNSSGPIHLAAAMGTAVIGLYPQATAMSEKRWGPYTTRKKVFVPSKPISCNGCRNAGDGRCLCMASIGVEEVYLAAHQMLEDVRKQHAGANA
jgi:ADP-heptose:LPS heptosyltransferase